MNQFVTMIELVPENPAVARRRAQTVAKDITQNQNWESITEQVERTYDACIMGSWRH